jgi:hypothetical protein
MGLLIHWAINKLIVGILRLSPSDLAKPEITEFNSAWYLPPLGLKPATGLHQGDFSMARMSMLNFGNS